jgi:hypothetical protein
MATVCERAQDWAHVLEQPKTGAGCSFADSRRSKVGNVMIDTATRNPSAWLISTPSSRPGSL